MWKRRSLWLLCRKYFELRFERRIIKETLFISGIVYLYRKSPWERTSARIEAVIATFLHSQNKLVCRASRKLDLPLSKVHRILQKRLKVKSYRYRLLQLVTKGDKDIWLIHILLRVSSNKMMMMMMMMMKFSYPKVDFSGEYFFIYAGILTDITWESRGVRTLMQ
jgi:hypothetical protein